MKKSTILTLNAYFNGANVDLSEVKTEIAAEAEKYETEAAAKKAPYDAAWPIVKSVMGDVPMNLADIFAACESRLPDGFSRHNLQYGLKNYWPVTAVRNDKAPNTYRLS